MNFKQTYYNSSSVPPRDPKDLSRYVGELQNRVAVLEERLSWLEAKMKGLEK